VSREIFRTAEKNCEALTAGTNIHLEMTPEVADLAGIYFDALDIPEKASNDSLHRALAVPYHLHP